MVPPRAQSDDVDRALEMPIAAPQRKRARVDADDVVDLTVSEDTKNTTHSGVVSKQKGKTTSRKGAALLLPHDFMVHKSDVLHLAELGFNVAIQQMAENHGFQEAVVREVYAAVSNVEQTDVVLKSMRHAAQARGEVKIGKLPCNREDIESEGDND